MADMQESVLMWMANGEVGISSKTMAYCALGMKYKDAYNPVDPGDFNRCLLLLDRVPAIRAHFPRIAGLSPQWALLIKHWGELEALFSDEVGIGWVRGHSAPRTYARMQQILSGETVRS